MPRISNYDLYLWGHGELQASHRTFGAHVNRGGTWFRVWAPRAEKVCLIGDFNDWDGEKHVMRPTGEGLARTWEIYVRGARPGMKYKYRVYRFGHSVDKTDPFAFDMEPPRPGGSAHEGLSAIIADLDFEWTDGEWMGSRGGPRDLERAVSVYEVHLGSWRRHEDGRVMTYRDIAQPLAEYVRGMGYTHVELMPVLEHPYYGSWGYQVVGYFAPTGVYGSPVDFKYLVNTLHEHGIGVILDWVPAHFATDRQGLEAYDGEPLFEYTDPAMRHHPDWGTYVFDYGRPQVRNFLISNALFWLDEYHVDGLRFDAVASMLYRDYSRENWTPNQFGGRENLEAVDFLKSVNEKVFSAFPTAMMIAEESTAWPGVSAPTYNGGLGFLYKWNMGWMHDTLEFFRRDPLYRQHHYHDFTFPLVYAWAEHYMLSLSHDEVVHGKGSLFGKMPGDDWQKAANLRLLFAHMFGHPGKKLMFMGMEFGQGREWSHDRGLDWWLLDATDEEGTTAETNSAALDGSAETGLHTGLQSWVRALNALYGASSALQSDAMGCFEWIDFGDTKNCVASYLRRVPGASTGRAAGEAGAGGGYTVLVFIFNFTPVPRNAYRVGLPDGYRWTVNLNSDSREFGGSGTGTPQQLTCRHGEEIHAVPAHGRTHSIVLDLPPLGVLVLCGQPVRCTP